MTEDIQKEHDDLDCQSVDRLFTLLSANTHTEGHIEVEKKSLHFMFTYTSTLVIAD